METASALAKYISEEFPVTPDGTWLPSERELAERFAVSRPVVREAAKRLELQGVIQIHHGKGAKVVNQFHKPFTLALELDIPDPKERLLQFSETRRLLEPESARQATLQATEGGLEELKAIHGKMELEEDLGKAALLDVQFHQQIVRMAGNRVNLLILESFADISTESRVKTLTSTSIERALGHHRQILDAILAGDSDGAAEAMLFHVREAATDLEGIL